MLKPGQHIHPDIKKQIIERIRSGEPVPKLAEEHGVSKATIYHWLSKDATAPTSSLEIGKLKRENQGLLEIIGRLTVELSAEKKRRWAIKLMPELKKRRITKKEVADPSASQEVPCTTIQNCRRKIGTLKFGIDQILHIHPAYGHKRLAIALQINKKRVRRVMQVFGIKPYRRRPKKL